MTAPVPPDANGLRERVEALADVLTQHGHPGEVLTVFGEAWIKCGCGAKIDLPVRDDKVSAADVARLFAEHQARALAASEAAPTAGERAAVCNVDPRLGLIPATPPDDDASEGLSEAERNLLDGCVRFQFSTDRNDMFAAVERIKARARAEGAAEALREAADFCEPVIGDALGSPRTDFSDGWRRASAQFLAELRHRAARSDAAPHTGGQP